MSSIRTALICGVSGQDGAYLSKLLIEKGYKVIGTSRDATVTTFNNLKKLGINKDVETASMALNDFRSVLQVLARYDPDEIYNLAGQSSVGLSFEQPVETMESICIGSLNLLEGIRFLNIKTKLYNASSSECFGDVGAESAKENTPFRPRSPYAVAKAAAYWEVANYREAYSLYACSGILFNHESPLRPERFVTQKIIKAVCRIKKGSRERLRLGNLEIIRDWGWAPEYVTAMWQMLQQSIPKDFIIATGKSYSLKEFVKASFEVVDLNWEDYVEIDLNLLRPTDISTSYANPSLAYDELGWKAKKFMPNIVEHMISEELKKT